MNPGAFVAGGGGDGGGGGGKGGKNGSGNEGAGDGSGDENAEGDGNGADACGEGSTGSCTSCGNTLTAGDPVNVATGEMFTVPAEDLFLRGFINLRFSRRFSSEGLHRQVGFGPGWVHSLAWTLEETRRQVIVTSSQFRVEFDKPVGPGAATFNGAWHLQRVGDGYRVRPGTEFSHYFVPESSGSKLYRLARVSFRNHGAFDLIAKDGRLERILDSAGREILFAWNRDRIQSISVPAPNGQTLTFARYSYDARGDLVAATDADGNRVEYAYDEQHRMVRLRYGTGLTFHFVYDGAGRCIETWGDYPDGKDVALADDLPELLADGSTPARGIYHCRLDFIDANYSEVHNSVGTKRVGAAPNGLVESGVSPEGGVHSRTFNVLGRVMEEEDPLGVVTRYTYHNSGKLESLTIEDETTTFERDPEGRVLGATDAAGGEIRYTRDRYGNIDGIRDQNGAFWSYRLDARGRVTHVVDPCGGQTALTFDDHGNCTSRTDPRGNTVRWEYDYWGRRVATIGPGGERAVWSRSPAGRLVAVTDYLGRTKHSSYDALGNLISVTTPDGRTTRFEWGGLRWLARVHLPDGGVIKRRFNREGQLCELEDPSGAVHRLDRDSVGRPLAEVTFDGRSRRAEYDLRGWQILLEEGARRIEMTRDHHGRIVEALTDDDEARNFAYSARGDLVRFENQGVVVCWERDAVGNIVRQTQEVDGRSYEVVSDYDPMTRQVRRRTSLGHEVQIKRGPAGHVDEIWTGGERVLQVQRDAAGDPVERVLSGGAKVLDDHDAMNRLVRRAVLPAHGEPSAPVEEPEWLGARDELSITYSYDAMDEVHSITRGVNDYLEYTYDGTRHVLEETDGRAERRLSVDAAGNYHEVDGPVRSYQMGNRLIRRGNTVYDYDERGALVSRREAQEDGKERETLFEWDGYGMLSAVALPDGRRVEFQYDAYARRVSKRVLGRLPEGTWQIVEHTHYVWDLISLVHEVDVLTETVRTTYLFDDHRNECPFAQSSDGADWTYFIEDLNGAPEVLVSGEGDRVGGYRKDLFGWREEADGERTPFRNPGQFADEETGLYYNRYRYYDPDTGAFISPDPIGPHGGLNPYGYGPNPIAWFDPMGWAHTMTVTSASGVNGVSVGDTFVSGMGPDCPDPLRSRARCHTERKLAHTLREANPNGAPGGRITVQGELPPCPNCHRAMQRLADDMRGSDPNADPFEIEYQYGPDHSESVTYSSGSSPSFTDSDLETAYAMTPTARTDSHGEPFGYEYTSWSNAQKGYKNAK